MTYIPTTFIPQDEKPVSISFIVYIHNATAPMLVSTLESLSDITAENDGFEYEVLLIDDGSDLPAIDMCGDLRDNRMIYLRLPFMGMPSAYNRALMAVRGKYIHFLQAGSRVDGQSLRRSLLFIQQHSPDILMFSVDMSEKNKMDSVGPIVGYEYMLHHNLHYDVTQMFIRRNLIGDLRFPPHLSHVGEAFLPQLFVRADRVYILSGNLSRNPAKSLLTSQSNTSQMMKYLSDMEMVISGLDELASRLPSVESAAMRRCTAVLTAGYLYDFISMTRDSGEVEKAITRLYDKGLFPLADKNYSRSYKWIRRMTKTSIGRKLLCRILPRR